MFLLNCSVVNKLYKNLVATVVINCEDMYDKRKYIYKSELIAKACEYMFRCDDVH